MTHKLSELSLRSPQTLHVWFNAISDISCSSLVVKCLLDETDLEISLKPFWTRCVMHVCFNFFQDGPGRKQILTSSKKARVACLFQVLPELRVASLVYCLL